MKTPPAPRSRSVWGCVPCGGYVAALVASSAVSLGSPAPVSGIPELAAVPGQAMQVLKAHCLECHNEDKKKAGLLLTSREAALLGGDGGVVLVPGKPKESVLLDMLLPEADPHMPPEKQLSAEQIRVLRSWVQGGVAWDDAAMAAPVVPELPVNLGDLPDAYQPVLTVALSNNGQRLAVGRGSRITIYDVGADGPTVAGQITGPHDAVQSLAWSADGRWLAAGEYRRIWLWDARTLAVTAELTKDLAGRITALEFTPDSTTLAAADGQPSLNGVVHLWDVATTTLSSSWTAHKDTIFGLKISHDGQWVATAGADKLAKVWELSTGEEVARLEGHTGHVLSVAFNEDNTSLASGGADQEIKIWDIKTKQKKIHLKNGAGVTAMAWTPDGKSLISVSDKGAPKIYTEFKDHIGTERSAGAKEKSLKTAGEMLYTVATVDAKAIYAGGHDGAVYIWGNDDQEPRKLEPRVEGKQLAEAR